MRLIALFFIALLALATPASAQSLDDAKAAGQLGERVDGYLGVVDAAAPAAVKAMADDINAKRKASYAEIAAKRNVPVEAVAQIAGKMLIEKTPSGQWVLGADGSWKQK